jgi:hypothetical protein
MQYSYSVTSWACRSGVELIFEPKYHLDLQLDAPFRGCVWVQ